MCYREKFKELLISTAKGFGIGLIASIVLAILLKTTSISDFIALIIGLTICIGSIVSIIICSKSGARGFMNSAALNLWSGIKGLFFGSLFSDNAILLIWGMFKLFLGIIISIPVGLYMTISYFVNFIYLGVMCLLEKFDLLKDKIKLCTILDKLVSIISGIIVVFLCISFIKIISG